MRAVNRSKKSQSRSGKAGAEVAARKGNKKLFALPRMLRAGVKRCGAPALEPADLPQDVQYLWASFKVDDTDGLSVEGWLNVVDEAASLGLDFIVFSMDSPLSENPGIWPVCRWAQETHGITVGIHVAAASLQREDIEAFKKLDMGKARLYVLRDELDLIRPLEKEGIRVGTADPRGAGRANPLPCCELPSHMLFVNQKGVMYTCRYVDNNNAFLLGHVEGSPLNHVMKNAALPHTVPADAPFITHGCDGCPPILIDEE